MLKNALRRLFLSILAFCIVSISSGQAFSQENKIPLVLDGKEISVSCIMVDGATLVPLSNVCSRFGIQVKEGASSWEVAGPAGRLKYVPGSAAAFFNYEIIPLRTASVQKDNDLWVDSIKLPSLLERLYKGILPEIVKTPDVSPVIAPDAPAKKEEIVIPRSNVSLAIRVALYPDKERVVFEIGNSAESRVSIGKTEVEITIDKQKSIPEFNVPNGMKSSLSMSLKGSGLVAKIAIPDGSNVKQFYLEDPRRLVLDILLPKDAVGVKIKEPVPDLLPTPTEADKTREITSTPPVKRGALLVVIDAGHGGKDSGAVGYKGLKEKVINLQMVKRLRIELDKMGLNVILTRDSDVYLKLAERTEIANKANADMFVSLHCNAMPGKKTAIKGFEVYLMALPTDRDAMELARVENAELADNGQKVRDQKTDMLMKILGDLQQNNKINESTQAAERVFYSVRDGGLPAKRVAQAPFFVLRGATMPALLIEMGFITNPAESQLLSNEKYQERLAKSIAMGIKSYLNIK